MLDETTELKHFTEAALANRETLRLLLRNTYGFKDGDVETFLTLMEAWMRAEINAGIAAELKIATMAVKPED